MDLVRAKEIAEAELWRKLDVNWFSPPTGGAVVFSCSLLHEATAITAGQRFVFLPFLYDDAAAKVREEKLKYIAPESTKS